MERRRSSWTITVRARSSGLDLRLAASNVFPGRGAGGESVSFLLRLRRLLLLEVRSENRLAAGAPPAGARAKLSRSLQVVFRSSGRWLARLRKKRVATSETKNNRKKRSQVPAIANAASRLQVIFSRPSFLKWRCLIWLMTIAMLLLVLYKVRATSPHSFQMLTQVVVTNLINPHDSFLYMYATETTRKGKYAKFLHPLLNLLPKYWTYFLPAHMSSPMTMLAHCLKYTLRQTCGKLGGLWTLLY